MVAWPGNDRFCRAGLRQFRHHQTSLDVTDRRRGDGNGGRGDQFRLAGALIYPAGRNSAQLAVRSVTTPFALAAAEPLGGQPDLVALFVVVTGVFGMAVGDALFLRLSIREGMAKGAGFGAASHGAGTARSYELGQQEGVVASLVMMLSGVVMVLFAPLVARLMF